MTGLSSRSGPLSVPGMVNLHSHAFQRGMAGLAERAGASEDSFWTWREVMYRFLDRLTPDDVEVIATMAYVEMLEAGYTRVVEFHYLHHDVDGRSYRNIAEMAERIAAAASATGIGLTLLPVFYAQGGFGGQPATPGQRRFLNTFEQFIGLREASAKAIEALPGSVIGMAPHSLRAVTPEDLKLAAEAFGGDGPIHIHVAEQEKEVADCLVWSGRRPVEWLLDTGLVDENWCLIHATHVTREEVARIAASKAVVGLCPITEANLGDGIFPAIDYQQAGGRFGVGTDSNVLISLAEELRTLEYGQRLRDRRRNRLASPGHSIGRTLFDAAQAGGRQAAGIAGLKSDDRVVLDANAVEFAGRSGDGIVDAWVFASGRPLVKEVWVDGKRVVEGGRHIVREAAERRFAATMARLGAEM
jgi:formimidoylglutamate deiminase